MANINWEEMTEELFFNIYQPDEIDFEDNPDDLDYDYAVEYRNRAVSPGDLTISVNYQEILDMPVKYRNLLYNTYLVIVENIPLNLNTDEYLEGAFYANLGECSELNNVDRLHMLDYLDISYTNVSDFSKICNVPNLILEGLQVEDVSQFKSVKYLNVVNCHNLVNLETLTGLETLLITFKEEYKSAIELLQKNNVDIITY